MYDIFRKFFTIEPNGIVHLYNLNIHRQNRRIHILLVSQYNNPIKFDINNMYEDLHTRFLLELKEMKI